MLKLYKKIFFLLFLIPCFAFAQQSSYVNVNAGELLQKADLFLSPATATIISGSTIEIPVFVNTEGQSINTVSLSVNFDPTKLALVNPSDSNSIIGIWVDPPTYSNTNGTLELSGVIPNGITTESGLITTMTFRALTTGQANVTISDASRILANDGQGTAVELEVGRGTYTILPQAPEGPQVFSETHPFQDTWYNNNSPVLAWNRDDGVSGFSFTLDDKPFTVPDNVIDATDTVISYPNLTDGIWYFHIKAQKDGIWGGTTNFVIRIDTAPPAAFTPQVAIVTASNNTQALVSFFTTDDLSGIDHYEVGVVDISKSPNSSPVFVQSDSPYALALKPLDTLRVTVRAFDRAGNVRDETITVAPPVTWINFLKQNWIIILLLLLLIGHYLFGHKIIARLKRIFKDAKNEEMRKKTEEQEVEKIEALEELASEESLQAKQKEIKDQYLKNLEAINMSQTEIPVKEEIHENTAAKIEEDKLLPIIKIDNQ